MAGLVVVALLDNAAETARRAAAPLLRHPWEHLALAATKEGRVVLGFAGERGGVAVDESTGTLAAVDGELFGPPRTGVQAAEEILALYLRDGVELDPPDGCIAIALWDPTEERLLLLTDRTAGRPLIVWRPGRAVVAAGELKALVAAGLPPELEPEGLAGLLAYRHLLGERAPLAGVHRIPEATTLEIAPDGDRRRLRWRYLGRPQERGDPRELAGELGRLIERAVEARIDGSEALALSGGLDSRCLAGILGRRGFHGPAATWTWPGSLDGRVAPSVAQAAGLRHRRLELERGYAAHRAARCVWLGELTLSPFRSQELSLPQLRAAEGVRSVLHGSMGDLVVRQRPPAEAGPGEAAFAAAVHRFRNDMLTDDVAAQVFTAPFAASIRGLAAAALAATLAEDPDGDRQARYSRLRFLRTPLSVLHDGHLAHRDPYVERELVDFCARLPHELRDHGSAQRAFLQSFPALARIPDPEDWVPPALTGRAERALRSATHVGRRWWRRLAPALPDRWGSTRAAHYRYALDLPHGGGRLFDLLLEPRTLARGQLREEPLRRLIAESVRGSNRYSGAMSMLVGLELFQRQFLDGDGDPGPIEDLERAE